MIALKVVDAKYLCHKPYWVSFDEPCLRQDVTGGPYASWVRIKKAVVHNDYNLNCRQKKPPASKILRVFNLEAWQ